MSARDELYAHLDPIPVPASIRDHLIDAFAAEVRAEVLGSGNNPSALVMDAEAYGRLRSAIEATMTDPGRWDGDADEETLLGRYVEWLAEQATGRTELDEVPLLPECHARSCDHQDVCPTVLVSVAVRDVLDGVLGRAARVAELKQHTTETPADFFQPGRTYTDGNGFTAPECITTFRPVAVTRHPDRGQWRAFGWARTGAEGWHGSFVDEDQAAGWAEAADGGESA